MKQLSITKRGYSAHEVAERLDISAKSLYHWRSQLNGKKVVRQSADDSVQIERVITELLDKRGVV